MIRFLLLTLAGCGLVADLGPDYSPGDPLCCASTATVIDSGYTDDAPQRDGGDTSISSPLTPSDGSILSFDTSIPLESDTDARAIGADGGPPTDPSDGQTINDSTAEPPESSTPEPPNTGACDCITLGFCDAGAWWVVYNCTCAPPQCALVSQTASAMTTSYCCPPS